MRNIIFIFGLISSTLFAQEENKEASQLLKSTIEQNKCVGIAAAYSINGKTEWIEAQGLSNSESKQLFTPSTKNRIASIAKPMTAVAIFQLLESNQLSLTDSIGKYLPYLPIDKQSISIEQLLNHSSGIGEYKNSKERENYRNYASTKDAVSIFIDRKLLFSPGTQFYYTSYGYVVLGLIIEEISGLTYENYVKQNIWDKVGISNTGIEHFDKNYPDKSQLFHINSKGKVSSEKTTNLSDRIPAGGIYSTTEDLIKFGNAILNNTLISEASKQKMFTDSGLKKKGNPYGLGWYLYGKNPNHGNVYGHNGAQIGASTFLMILPEKEAVVVVMANTSGAMQTVSNICIALFNYL